jgi:hypothetical protein
MPHADALVAADHYLQGMWAVRVTAPKGVQWKVRVVWRPRWRSLERRFDEWREKSRGYGTPPFWTLDVTDPVGCLVTVIGGTILVVLVLWIVLPLLLLIVDLAIVVVLLVVTVVARVLFRRPWTVEATTTGGRSFTTDVTGLRAAFRQRDEIADQLRRGQWPASQYW